jgi:hypothetical protein
MRICSRLLPSRRKVAGCRRRGGLSASIVKTRTLLCAGVGLMLANCGGSAGPRAAASDPLVGAWRSDVAFQRGALASIKGIEFLYAFNAGGTMTESSNYDGAPPVPPAYGVWRQIAPGRYEARYQFFTTQPPKDWQSVAAGGGWNPAGSGDLRETIELGIDGRSFTSTISLALFDTNGKPVDGGGSGSGRGKRIGF